MMIDYNSLTTLKLCWKTICYTDQSPSVTLSWPHSQNQPQMSCRLCSFCCRLNRIFSISNTWRSVVLFWKQVNIIMRTSLNRNFKLQIYSNPRKILHCLYWWRSEIEMLVWYQLGRRVHVLTRFVPCIGFQAIPNSPTLYTTTDCSCDDDTFLLNPDQHLSGLMLLVLRSYRTQAVMFSVCAGDDAVTTALLFVL